MKKLDKLEIIKTGITTPGNKNRNKPDISFTLRTG
jgi:hypothetical protein